MAESVRVMISEAEVTKRIEEMGKIGRAHV